MSNHTEDKFEDDICNHLASHGWLYEKGDAKNYVTPKALYPADIVEWVKVSQPQAWETLTKNHGVSAQTILVDQLRKQLDNRGTLDVLRNGIDLIGLRSRLSLAQFKPALAMNADLQARYAANRLRVVRQVRTNHNDAIDLVLFLNGIPVATAELKTNFTQDINDAVEQYKHDRTPCPKDKAGTEPLLSFPSGALVHFAVSNSTVMMTTHLKGEETYFLPFNLGNEGGAGNPPNPNGHKTAYLWEQVWQRESWLEIIGRYLVQVRNEKNQIKAILFPRYHQLDATRKLVQSVQTEGAGQKYLIQHSAGSGKTNSIAWTAHFFADLHDANNHKVFNTVLVISDRTVLDSQLQEAVCDLQRTAGVVATITGNTQSKSQELAQALSGDKKIVVCTIQTFPFALEIVRELAATQGKRFAVIADEAHSSQTGDAASKLKQVLSAEELKDLTDGGEYSTEDVLAAQMSIRAGSDERVTYVAFTATPKAKTLELFGRLPNPNKPAGDDNLPQAFHVYSMRQAIEEEFILDVLRNYTPYKLAFKLAHDNQQLDEQTVEKSEAIKHLMRWVRLHPYNISQKVQVVVEHFRANVQSLLSGHAKAMVVLSSRLEAVRWKKAIDAYIKANNYRLGTLVAYSGEINDEQSFPEAVTERNVLLNPSLNGRDMREAFNTDEFQIMLVANKFQTGFDQPLLCGMYVDKRLGGVQAVQTLSRLNRAYNGSYGKKDLTYILDFVNEPDDILAAFKPYYETAELSGVTDPYLVFNISAKLDACGYYDEGEVERVALVELDPKAKQADLIAAIEPVADRLLKKYKLAKEQLHSAQAISIQQASPASDSPQIQTAKDEMNALMLFKSDLATFLRAYAFLSQIIDYANTGIEKRALFYKRLLPLLEFGRERQGIDLSKVTLSHHKLKDLGTRDIQLGGVTDGSKLTPLTEAGSGQVQEKTKIQLSKILGKMNDLFGGDLTDDDMLVFHDHILNKLLASDVLIQQSSSNSKQQFSNSPDLRTVLEDAIMDAFTAHTSMSKQALESEAKQKGMLEMYLGPSELYERLRAKGNGDSIQPPR